MTNLTDADRKNWEWLTSKLEGLRQPCDCGWCDTVEGHNAGCSVCKGRDWIPIEEPHLETLLEALSTARYTALLLSFPNVNSAGWEVTFKRAHIGYRAHSVEASPLSTAITAARQALEAQEKEKEYEVP